MSLAATHVLLVGCDDELASAVADQLVTVERAATLEQALEIARRTTPDVVFVDAAIDGVARRIHQLPKCADVPIALVGSEGWQPRRTGSVEGVSLYLARPVPADTVAVALRRLVEQRKAARPKVLVVDDDAGYLDATRRVLAEAGFVVRTIDDPRLVLDALAETPVDVLVTDLHMPELSGIELCRMIRTSADFQDLPVVVLTSDTHAQLAAFRAGADDFLAKESPAEELVTRVRGRVERTRHLRERGERDALTGLHRRGAFTSMLISAMNQAKRRERPLALAILDLDRFKQVNDEHGHLAGDRVLAAFGSLVSSSLRAEDLRGRWGGEEIVIAFPDEDAQAAGAALHRLLCDFAAIEFAGEGRAFRVSFSAGVATFPRDGVTPSELIGVADRRLYVAKQLGRARVIAEG